jgi:hypothetical protein
MTEQHETAARATDAPGESPPKHAQPPPRHVERGRAPVTTSASSGWTGVVVFAGIMFVILGAAEAAMAITTGFDESFYTVPSTELVVSLSYNVWGWVHLALGTFAVVTGWGLLTGRRWASTTGIALALVNALSNVVFLRAYPWWSLTAIALDVLIIHAITRHSSEELRRPG